MKLDFSNHASMYFTNIFVSPIIIHRCIRLRGGVGPREVSDKEQNKIPYLSERQFRWNGQPQVDAQYTVIIPLNLGLGSISDKGWTLLDTARQKDAGGVFGNPSRAVALITNPQLVEESKARNRRLFCSILTYIDDKSHTYRMYVRLFNTNGIDVYNHIIATCNIPIPPKLLYERERYFKQMSMESLKMFINAQAIFKWVDIVMEVGNMVGANAIKQKDQFVDGLPDRIFKSEKTAMRQDRRFVIPATYGGMIGFPPSMAAVPHPFAGQPDIKLLALAYYAQWLDAVKGIDDRAVRFMAREALLEVYQSTHEQDQGIFEESTSTHDTDLAHMVDSSEITWSNTCVVCGGHGHTARCKYNGGMLECPTLVLRTKPEDLIPGRKTDKKPTGDNDKYKKKAAKQAHLIKQLTEKNAALEAQIESMHGSSDGSGSDMSGSTTNDDNLDAIDEDSDVSSDGSTVKDFADQAKDGKKKMFRKPYKPK